MSGPDVPSLISQQTDALVRSMQRSLERTFLSNLPVLNDEQREQVSRANEQHDRERREAAQARTAAREQRHRATLDRCTGALAAVVRLHAPDGEDCAGCDVYADVGLDNPPPDWPCSTFTLIERDTQ